MKNDNRMNGCFILDEYHKLDGGLFAIAIDISNKINDIVGVPIEFKHILQTGFDNDKRKSNGKMYVSDVKSGSNIVNKMAEKFVDTDIVIR